MSLVERLDDARAFGAGSMRERTSDWAGAIGKGARCAAAPAAAAGATGMRAACVKSGTAGLGWAGGDSAGCSSNAGASAGDATACSSGWGASHSSLSPPQAASAAAATISTTRAHIIFLHIFSLAHELSL